VALWSGEEEGILGSQAYVKEHFGSFENQKQPEYSNLAAYLNIDSGTGRARGAGVFGPPSAAAVVRQALAPFIAAPTQRVALLMAEIERTEHGDSGRARAWTLRAVRALLRIRRAEQERSELFAREQAARHEADRANRLKDEFLATISHELRTPMNAVIGFATLLEGNAQTSAEEGRDFARSIREAAQHLLGVINDLLDLAKVEAGRFELKLMPGDLRPAVTAAVEAVGPIAAKKGLNLKVDLPMEPLEAALDPNRMRQIMLNLLGNAVKFTDKGSVGIRAWRDPATEIRVFEAAVFGDGDG